MEFTVLAAFNPCLAGVDSSGGVVRWPTALRR